MKKSLLLGLLAIGLLIAYVSLTSPEGSAGGVKNEETIFPENVAQIFQLSCYDCHTSASKNIRAKEKVNFDTWNELTPAQKINKLDAICNEITKGKMPTEKYLSYNPDRKLSPDQINLICTWVEEESKKIMGAK